MWAILNITGPLLEWSFGPELTPSLVGETVGGEQEAEGMEEEGCVCACMEERD